MDIIERFEIASKHILDSAQANLNAIPGDAEQKLKELKAVFDKTIENFTSTIPDLRLENVIFSKVMIVDQQKGHETHTSGQMNYCRNEDTFHITAGVSNQYVRETELPVDKNKKLKVRIIVTEDV